MKIQVDIDVKKILAAMEEVIAVSDESSEINRAEENSQKQDESWKTAVMHKQQNTVIIGDQELPTYQRVWELNREINKRINNR